MAKLCTSHLIPFFTFEAQNGWYHDLNSTYYYANILGAVINSFKSQGVYKQAAPTVADISVASDVYTDLENLKSQTDKILGELGKADDLPSQARLLVRQANSFYAAYDYLDAERGAEAAAHKLRR